jgi:hypothetical protein
MKPAPRVHHASDDANNAPGQPIRLDLHPALAVLGHYDGVYVVLSDLPIGTRLSAGRSNANLTWSLSPAELEELTLTLPDGRTEIVLTASVVTPDPDGYEFAYTSAQFNIVVADGRSTIPFNSLKRIEPHHHQDWPGLVQRAADARRLQVDARLNDDRDAALRRPTGTNANSARAAEAYAAAGHDAAAEARLLAAARAEWQADEEARLMRARAQWEIEAADTWARLSAEMAERHDREIKEAEARWHGREQERLTINDALWSARLAAQEIHWRSEETQRFAAAIGSWRTKLRSERWRRAACWLAFSVTTGALLLA